MHTPIRFSLASLVVSLVAAGSAAGQVTVPPDLAPGDSYRLLVVTQGTTTAFSDDISVYNAFVHADVTSVPEMAALGTTWTAVASTPTVDARDNTGTNPTAEGIQGVPIYILDGTRFADHDDALWTGQGPTVGGAPVPDGSIPYVFDASGGFPPIPQVWTGSNQSGTGHPRSLGSGSPVIVGICVDGTHPFPSFSWALYNQFSPSSELPLFALSGVLTVEAPSFCDASDGALASCPCGNPGNPDSGCDIAQGTGGVRLDVAAQETAPENRATLTGTGFPATGTPAAVVIRSSMLDAGSPVAFGDGLRCVGTPLVRLGAAFAIGGTSTHVLGHGASAGPGQFAYQVWFRNTPVGYCDPTAAFNLSNGRMLEW